MSVIFVKDTFTGAAGTLLTAHTGEIGGWLSDTSGWTNYSAANAKLTGTGFLYAAVAGTNSKETTALSDVVAPQLDFYVEMNVNVGVQSSSSTTHLKFYAHHQANLPSGTQYEDTGSIFFDTTVASIFAPGGYGSPNPYQTDLPAVADNSNHVVRIEYRYGTPEIKFFFDGVLAATWGAPMYSLPTVSANFGFDIDSYSSPSGNGITVDYIELGTLDAPIPPSAFWTDYTGSIHETV